MYARTSSRHLRLAADFTVKAFGMTVRGGKVRTLELHGLLVVQPFYGPSIDGSEDLELALIIQQNRIQIDGDMGELKVKMVGISNNRNKHGCDGEDEGNGKGEEDSRQPAGPPIPFGIRRKVTER